MQKKRSFLSKMLIVLGLMLAATGVYAADGSLTVDVGVRNDDGLWYNASQVASVTVDGQTYELTPVGDYDGTVTIPLAPGSHTVVFNYVSSLYDLMGDSCTGTVTIGSGQHLFCGADLDDRFDW